MFREIKTPKHEQVKSILRYFIDDGIMKALMYLCLSNNIPDNNVKAEIVKQILGEEFPEIGTGTNRIAVRYNGLVLKIALDRRG